MCDFSSWGCGGDGEPVKSAKKGTDMLIWVS